MKDQLNTIRKSANDLAGGWNNQCWAREKAKEILAALAQLEAMAGEPVHQFRKEHCADWHDGHADHSDGSGPYEERTLYRAAPVAQQPQVETDESIAADAYGLACDEMERWQHERRKAGKDAGTTGSLVDGIAWLYWYINDLETQQPQAEPITEAAIDAYLDDYEMRGETEDGRDACYTPSEREKFLIKDAIMGLLAEIPPKQPQAEAVPNTLKKAEAHLLNLIGEYWGLAYAEGAEGRNHDTEDGAAQRTHAAIAKAVNDLIAAASSAPQQAEAVPPTHVLEDIKAKVAAFFKGDDKDLKLAGRALIEVEMICNRALTAAKKEAGHE